MRLSAAILSLVVSLLCVTSAFAQSSEDILKQEMAGPYRVTVLSRPREPEEGRGGPRYTVEVLNAVDLTPVNDATVIIIMDRPDGSKAGQLSLDRNLAVPGIYEGRVSVPQTGVWRWAVDISSPRGDGLVEGTLTVVPGPSSGAKGLYAWFGLLLALAILVSLAWRSLGPRKAQQAGRTP